MHVFDFDVVITRTAFGIPFGRWNFDIPVWTEITSKERHIWIDQKLLNHPQGQLPQFWLIFILWSLFLCFTQTPSWALFISIYSIVCFTTGTLSWPVARDTFAKGFRCEFGEVSVHKTSKPHRISVKMISTLPVMQRVGCRLIGLKFSLNILWYLLKI